MRHWKWRNGFKNMQMTNATENVANGNILFMIASK